MIKKYWLWLCLLLMMSMTGCKKEEPQVTIVPEPIVIKADVGSIVGKYVNGEINPLTGLYISKEAAARRPIGIMINNLKAAQPQSGIGQADVIYETLVEGSITRLYALFQDFDAEKIGPVRSARHYFLDFAFDFDAIYVHYGQSPQADIAFSQLDPPHLNGLSYLDTIMCFQDPNRVRPHSTYTSYDGLMAAWDYEEYRKEIDQDYVDDSKFKFNDEDSTPNSSVQVSKVSLNYSNYSQPWFEYNEDEGMYYRFQYDAPQIDVETDTQLKYKNIIVQLADMWVIAGDTEGRLDMSLISSGKGYYITNGVSIPITWKKTSHESPTHYYLEDGSELLLNKGKTWISVFPAYRTEYLLFE